MTSGLKVLPQANVTPFPETKEKVIYLQEKRLAQQRLPLGYS